MEIKKINVVFSDKLSWIILTTYLVVYGFVNFVLHVKASPGALEFLAFMAHVLMLVVLASWMLLSAKMLPESAKKFNKSFSHRKLWAIVTSYIALFSTLTFVLNMTPSMQITSKAGTLFFMTAHLLFLVSLAVWPLITMGVILPKGESESKSRKLLRWVGFVAGSLLLYGFVWVILMFLAIMNPNNY